MCGSCPMDIFRRHLFSMRPLTALPQGCSAWRATALRPFSANRHDRGRLPISNLHPVKTAGIFDSDPANRWQFFLDELMRFTPTKLADAWVVEPELLQDNRGLFARTYCAREFCERDFRDSFLPCNTSSNDHKGTLRGLHYQ